jgi:photosystem II stability/assembly factor-like uncharacterized protein
VKTRDNIAINAIEVFAINGSLVASEFGINTLSRQIDIADLTSGLYVIKVTTEKGIVSRKLFKN